MSAPAKAYSSREHPVMQPRPAIRYRFALTPLADVMFQLLIFFMLASAVAPYSLLTVSNGTSPDGPVVYDPVASGNNTQIWEVSPGQIDADGQTVPLGQLAEMAASLGEDSDTTLILVMKPAARMQDMASVLEALTASGVTAVQIAHGGSQ